MGSIFAYIVIMFQVFAGVSYAFGGDLKRMAFWLAIAVANLAVTIEK